MNSSNYTLVAYDLYISVPKQIFEFVRIPFLFLLLDAACHVICQVWLLDLLLVYEVDRWRSAYSSLRDIFESQMHVIQTFIRRRLEIWQQLPMKPKNPKSREPWSPLEVPHREDDDTTMPRAKSKGAPPLLLYRSHPDIEFVVRPLHFYRKNAQKRLVKKTCTMQLKMKL